MRVDWFYIIFSFYIGFALWFLYWAKNQPEEDEL